MAGNLLEPALDSGRSAVELRFKAARQAHELVRHVCKRIASLIEICLEGVVVEGFIAVVHRQYRRHIGVHHEPGQRAQDEFEVIRGAAAAAFGMGDRDYPVDVLQTLHLPLEAARQSGAETGGRRGGSEHDDEVAGASASASGPDITLKVCPVFIDDDLFTGLESVFVYHVGLRIVDEVVVAWQLEIDIALGQDP